MQVVQHSPPLCGFGGHKHLVECGGDLHVVDRYFGSEGQCLRGVSTREFPGVKGNCIMFTEQDFGPVPAEIGMGSKSRHCRVFDLADWRFSVVQGTLELAYSLMPCCIL
ncbi:hypothetical protein ACLB2K_003282 [Fragaria x ananassa]